MTIPYEAEAKRHGKLYKVLVPRLTLPVCRNCGAKYFTIEADDQINAALTRIISVAKAFEAATAVGE